MAGDAVCRYWWRHRRCGQPASFGSWLPLSLPLLPEPHSRQGAVSSPQTHSHPCRVLRGLFTVLTATSGQGGLLVPPRSACLPLLLCSLAGGSFPCPRCVNTGVSAPGCTRDTLPYHRSQAGSSAPGHSQAASWPQGGPAGGVASELGRVVLDRMQFPRDCWAGGRRTHTGVPGSESVPEPSCLVSSHLRGEKP